MATPQKLWRISVRFDVTPQDWQHGTPEQIERTIAALVDTGGLREIVVTRDRLEILSAVPADVGGAVLEQEQRKLLAVAQEEFERAQDPPIAVLG